MRHPRMSYAYITVDESQLPREVTSDARVRIARSGSPSLASYLRICRQMVPNVHHEEVVLNKEVSPFTMVLIQDGAVVGGITFRMLLAQPMLLPGTPKKNVPPSQLIVDIQLMAVAGAQHRRGFGRQLVAHARLIARAQARALGLSFLFFLVQADNFALAFWRSSSFGDEKAALRLACQLNRWRPTENLIYNGATPLGVRERLLDYYDASSAAAAALVIKRRCKRPRAEGAATDESAAAAERPRTPPPLTVPPKLALTPQSTPVTPAAPCKQEARGASSDVISREEQLDALSPFSAFLAAPSASSSPTSAPTPTPEGVLRHAASPQSPEIAALAAGSARVVDKIAGNVQQPTRVRSWTLPPLYVHVPQAPPRAAPSAAPDARASSSSAASSSSSSVGSVPPPPPSPRDALALMRTGSEASNSARANVASRGDLRGAWAGRLPPPGARRQPSLASSASDGTQECLPSQPESVSTSTHSSSPRLKQGCADREDACDQVQIPARLKTSVDCLRRTHDGGAASPRFSVAEMAALASDPAEALFDAARCAEGMQLHACIQSEAARMVEEMAACACAPPLEATRMMEEMAEAAGHVGAIAEVAEAMAAVDADEEAAAGAATLAEHLEGMHSTTGTRSHPPSAVDTEATCASLGALSPERVPSSATSVCDAMSGRGHDFGDTMSDTSMSDAMSDDEDADADDNAKHAIGGSADDNAKQPVSDAISDTDEESSTPCPTGREWCCERCTLANEDWRKKCRLCFKMKPGPRERLAMPRMLMEILARDLIDRI